MKLERARAFTTNTTVNKRLPHHPMKCVFVQYVTKIDQCGQSEIAHLTTSSVRIYASVQCTTMPHI